MKVVFEDKQLEYDIRKSINKLEGDINEKFLWDSSSRKDCWRKTN